jgi:CubicO group peptidase (beta-lactamase class C family)
MKFSLFLFVFFSFATATSPSSATTFQTTPSPLSQALQLAKEYQQNDSFVGVWQVVKNSKPVFSKAFGFANEENQVKMTPKKIFPIGSNSKLFTAVALYQLQEQGKVDLSKPVNEALTKEDLKKFGFPNQTTWCPRVGTDANQSSSSNNEDCEEITYQQLLSMSSGIGDSFTCDNVQGAKCHAQEFLGVYRGSTAAYVGLFINDPLVFKPGTNYSYSNPNFVLARYLVEKISRLSLAEYLKQHIVEPVGLQSTVFDPFDGQFGFVKDHANQYYQFYAADTNKQLGSCACGPFLSAGATNGAGGLLKM